MIARLTWQPSDTDSPETLTADIPDDLVHQMRELMGTTQWATSEAVAWLSCRSRDDQPFKRRLFRLARITALEAQR